MGTVSFLSPCSEDRYTAGWSGLRHFRDSQDLSYLLELRIAQNQLEVSDY